MSDALERVRDSIKELLDVVDEASHADRILEGATTCDADELCRSRLCQECGCVVAKVQRANRALALLPAIEQGMSWRPIETAPKDGTRLLLWDGFSVFEGLWNDGWCCGLRQGDGRPWTKAWQPLPTPPKTEG